MKIFNKKKYDYYNFDEKPKDRKISLKKYILTILPFLLLLISGTSYALITMNNYYGVNPYSLLTGTLSIAYNENSAPISINNMIPMSDAKGLAKTDNSYQFTINNTGSIDATYQVRLKSGLTDNNLKDELDLKYVRFSLKIGNGDFSTPILLSEVKGDNVLYEGTLESLKNITITVKFWLDINADNSVMGKIFDYKIEVNSSQQIAASFANYNPPTITLNEGDIILKQGDTFTDPGVLNAINYNNQYLDISTVNKKIEYFNGATLIEVENINTSNIGVYYITYSIADNLNNIGKKVRTVVVNRSNVIPTITLNGDSVIHLLKNRNYTESNATALDQDNNSLNVLKIGYVNQDAVGTYYIRYVTVDSNNNFNSITRTIYVSDTTEDECFTISDAGVISAYTCPYNDIIIPESINGITITSIQDAPTPITGVFAYKNLIKIKLPETIHTIGDFAFLHNNIEKIEIPSSVKYINSSAFNNCGIKYLTLNDGLLQVYISSFGSNEITTVNIPSTVTRIYYAAFESNLITSYIIPNSVTYVGPRIFNDNQLSTNTAFIYERDYLGRDITTSIVSYGGADKTSVTIPSAVTKIGEYTFYKMDLTSITIPSNVTSIDNNALYKNATVNNNLTTIINQTNSAFDWGLITNAGSSQSFVTGTINHPNGNITVTS